MRRQRNISLVTAIFMAIALALFLPVFSTAGNLEPNDPPGPTMYTLEEILKAVTPLPTGFELWADNTRFAVSNEGTPDVNSDDIVLDRATGLMWTRNANLGGVKNWQDAVNYCNSLGELVQIGRWWSFGTDWRLPSIEELTTLSEPYPSTHNPALPAGHPFENVQSGLYWSVTTSAGTTSSAWGVDLSNGYVFNVLKTYNFYVWCVRGGH
jgi:hypothetical protein